MSVFLDSAMPNDLREAASYGLIAGATTNPVLLAKAGYKDLYAAMVEICTLLPGTIFYQLTSHTLPEMEAEYHRFREISPNLALKIPCNLTGLQFAARVSHEISIAMTAIFTPAQAYLASQAGAHYVLPFVNRTTRYTGTGLEVLTSIVDVIQGSTCEVLAVSLKTPAEVVEVVKAGADHISITLPLIKEMAESPLTNMAMAEFDQSLKEMRG